jgi:hypothetical protein
MQGAGARSSRAGTLALYIRSAGTFRAGPIARTGLGVIALQSIEAGLSVRPIRGPAMRLTTSHSIRPLHVGDGEPHAPDAIRKMSWTVKPERTPKHGRRLVGVLHSITAPSK